MPIAIACPSCGSRLTAPDHAAGKRVKCPACAALVLVPAAADEGFEVVDEGLKGGKSRSARPITGGEGSGRGRPRRPADKAATNSVSLLVVGAAAGGLVVVLAGIIGFAVLAPRAPKPAPPVASAPAPEPPAPTPAPAPPPPPQPAAPQWVWFELPDTPAFVVFPNGPPAKADPLAGVTDGPAADLLAIGPRIDRWAKTDGDRTYTATVLRVPEAFNLDGLGLDDLFSPQDMLKTAAANPLLTGGGREASRADGTQHGVPYRHLVLQTAKGVAVARVFGLKGAAVGLRVEGPGLTADDRFAGEFLAAFRPKPAGPAGKK